MKPVALMLAATAFALSTEQAFAQCNRAGAGQGSQLGGGGFTTNTNQSALPGFMDAHEKVKRQHAMFAAQIYQTAARQRAAALVRAQRTITAKNRYREQVFALAEATGREPRLSRHEQLRLKVIARHEQQKLDRMTRPSTSTPVRQPQRTATSGARLRTTYKRTGDFRTRPTSYP